MTEIPAEKTAAKKVETDEEHQAATSLDKIKADPLPEGANARLEITAGSLRGKNIHLKKPLMVIGRVAGSADIVIADPMASRRHAAIAYCGGTFKLYDLGSRNGTLLNKAKAQESALNHGDEIEIGQVVFTFWND
jgi:pSer/pThr/pTyr-binding forkhead associated (FHA) protein